MSALGTHRITRRQALGVAAAGAAAAAGARLITLRLPAPVAGGAAASAAGPAGAWSSPLGGRRGLAAHLLRRAGFAHSAAELDAASAMTYTDLVDSVVAQRPDVPAPPADRLSYTSVVAWWYAHMARTAAQFPERMALFWHGHLTSDFRKAAALPFVYQQNQLYRTRGTGDLRTLMLAVTTDPLMMRYLDLDRSTGASPNENFSREVMELFLLGAGNYTEADVRAGARAFSGLRTILVDASGAEVRLPAPAAATRQQYEQQLAALLDQGATFKGVIVPRLHDAAIKTFLGRTGPIGPEEAVDAMLAREACAPFIARAALVHFCTPSPSAAQVAAVAGAFRRSGYDIGTLMRAVFTSEEFTTAGAYRSLVRSPADYMVATMRALGRPELATRGVTQGQSMDQVLYDPPTVAGWPVNDGWISSSAWLARVNFAQVAISLPGELPDAGAAVHSQLDGVVGTDTAAVFDASQTNSDRWYALLASPEFHLK